MEQYKRRKKTLIVVIKVSNSLQYKFNCISVSAKCEPPTLNVNVHMCVWVCVHIYIYIHTHISKWMKLVIKKRNLLKKNKNRIMILIFRCYFHCSAFDLSYQNACRCNYVRYIWNHFYAYRRVIVAIYVSNLMYLPVTQTEVMHIVECDQDWSRQWQTALPLDIYDHRALESMCLFHRMQKSVLL